MEYTRRLSLTLLLVTPIITARRLSFEDLGLSGPSAWGGSSEREELSGDWSDSAEPRDTYGPAVYYEMVYGDLGSWPRRKRALDSPGDDLETAEQVLFRPSFRYKHLVKEREERHRQQELRRQFTNNSPAPASSSPSVVTSLPPAIPLVQKNYYSAYPQQNQRVYTPQTSPVQRVYTPQTSPVQRVYSPQASPAQRVYPVNPPRIVPNYSQTAQVSPQYPQSLHFSRNEVFRPQRSPYAYLYSKRLN